MARRYLIVMGPPGAGKGTQASRVSSERRLCRIATGDLLRAALADGTPLGLQAKSYMEAGNLVPDDLILDMVAEELDRDGCGAGAVFDGFPRTVEQVQGLGRLLEERVARLERVLVIEVPEEEIVRRISGRRVCQNCEKLYHMSFDPPKVEGRCDACGGELVQRPDDRPDTIRRRLAVYREETQPVIEFYERETSVPVTEIDGDRPIDEVADVIRRELEAVEVE
jgi:adenylate kinase